MSEPTINEKVQQLIGKLPPEFKHIAEKYGPIVVQWGKDELWAWIELLSHNPTAAYEQLVNSLPESSLPAEWASHIEAMADLNISSSAKVAVMKEAGSAIAGVVLRMALAVVGF